MSAKIGLSQPDRKLNAGDGLPASSTHFGSCKVDSRVAVEHLVAVGILCKAEVVGRVCTVVFELT